MWCTLILKYLLSLPVGGLYTLPSGMHTWSCDPFWAEALRAYTWFTIFSLPLCHYNQQCSRQRLLCQPEPHRKCYRTKLQSIIWICSMRSKQTFLYKPLRFWDCSFPQYNLIYPNWYGHLGNHG